MSSRARVPRRWLPGSLLLPWLVPAWWRRMRRGDARTVVIVGWAVLVILFFSASPGKREVYLLPALPALCIAAAPLLPGLLRRTGVRATLLAYVVIMSAALLVSGGAGLMSASWVTKALETNEIAPGALRQLAGWMLALGIVGAMLVAWGRMVHAGKVALAFNLVLWMVYGTGLAVALNESSSGREIMSRVRDHIGPTAALGLVGWREQHLLPGHAMAGCGFLHQE